MKLPKSIRWRLPLSYAGIALLATLALGAVLLTTLRGYYSMREQDNLFNNAQLISDTVSKLYLTSAPSQDVINTQINTFSFISQARVQLYDPQNKLMADSGNPSEKRVIAFNGEGIPTGTTVVYIASPHLLPDLGAPGVLAQDLGYTTVSGSAQKSQPGAAGMLAQGLGYTTIDQTSLTPMPGATGVLTEDLSYGKYALSTTPPNVNSVTMVQNTTSASGAVNGSINPPSPDQFTFAVSGSPYGIGLQRDFSVDDHSDQAVTVPVYTTAQKLLGTIAVSDGPAYGTEIIDGMTWALIGAGVAAMLVAAVAGWFMSRSITAPLLMLTAATARMSEGELSTRVTVKRSDEFGVLAQSFDKMAQRVETTVSALRRFVADAAHQIHTPLTAVHADLELAASEPDPIHRQMFIERALAQLKRIEALTDDLLDLSRLEAHAVDERRTVVDLVVLVRESSELFASRAEQAGIAFNVETPPQSVKARINETQFRHAIGNLLDNAIKFTPENGSITVGVRDEGDQVELWVNDTGIGISGEDLPQIFNRFHRGRNAYAYPGSGLGLAIIKAIVEGHHGQISVESSAEDGTHFALRVPIGA